MASRMGKLARGRVARSDFPSLLRFESDEFRAKDARGNASGLADIAKNKEEEEKKKECDPKGGRPSGRRDRQASPRDRRRCTGCRFNLRFDTGCHDNSRRRSRARSRSRRSAAARRSRSKRMDPSPEERHGGKKK